MKMKFTEDKFYDGKLIYVKDVVHDVPDETALRWERRGGILIEQHEPVESVEKEEQAKVPEDTKPAEVKKKFGKRR